MRLPCNPILRSTLILVTLLSTTVLSQAPLYSMPTENQEIRLWPTGTPEPYEPTLVEEHYTEDRPEGDTLEIYKNPKHPSITLYLTGKEKRAPMVLVCPGGGYNILAWDLEGTEIADWLNSIGFSAAILKYRTNQNREGALQDAQRALGLLRSNASKWNIDPQRTGVLGFSAGAHLSASLSTGWRNRNYPQVDEADDVSCRPDFTVLVYPAYLSDENLNTTEGIKIDDDTPPAFIVQTQDDTGHASSSLAYYTALFKQDIPAELHLFPKGGHGYGIRPSAAPVSHWHNLAATWLKSQ